MEASFGAFSVHFITGGVCERDECSGGELMGELGTLRGWLS